MVPLSGEEAKIKTVEKYENVLAFKRKVDIKK